MSFARRLDRVLREMASQRIVGARFVPLPGGQYGAEVTYEDGLVEVIFQFDPKVVGFAQQELVGLTKEQALLLKDHQTDKAVGIEPPA